MEEKDNKFSIEAENLKNETVNAAKKVKESMKGANIKEETKATKNFVIEMFKKPLEKIKEVATDNSAKFFKTAIFLIIIWGIILFVDSTYLTIRLWGFSRVFSKILNVLKDILAPIIGILAYSIIILLLKKKNKKSLTNIISTVTITQIPLIISDLVSLLTMVSLKFSIIINPFAKICSVVAVVFGYFGFKNLFDEEEDNIFIKKYVFIQLIYYAVYFITQFIGIYI